MNEKSRSGELWPLRCRGRRVLIAGLLLATAVRCGGNGANRQHPVPTQPTTDSDPFPAFPAPATEAATGGPTACACSGETEQARRVALAVVSAVLRRDESALGDLFQDTVVRIRSRRTVRKTVVIASCMRALRGAERRAEQRIADVVDVDRIRAATLRADTAWGDLPEGLRPDDVVVDIPLQPTESPSVALCFQYSSTSLKIYVRPGAKAGVVAVYR